MTDPITTWQAARIIGCGQRHVIKLFHAGRLRGAWFGSNLAIERSSAEDYTPDRPGPRRGGKAPIEQSQPYARKP